MEYQMVVKVNEYGICVFVVQDKEMDIVNLKQSEVEIVRYLAGRAIDEFWKMR